MIKYLLDTNIVIYTIKGAPEITRQRFKGNSGRMAISTITYAELLHGVEKSTQPSKNYLALQDFCSRLVVLDYGIPQAEHYGQIRASLERGGQIIGINDLHIAAHARSLGLICVTNNKKEFVRVPGLQIENWAVDDSGGD